MNSPPDDIVVLGAGIGGLAAADILARTGRPVTVIEQADKCGGAHRSHEIGPYTFDAGSIFYEETARLFALSAELRPLCPVVRRVQRRIDPEGAVQHYPLDPRDLRRWSKRRRAKAVLDMAKARMTTRRDGTLETVCQGRLGRTLYQETGLAHYLRRFHHVSATQLDENFFFYRMGFIERQTRLGPLLRAGMCALTGRRAKRMRVPLRVRPRAGFDVLFDHVAGGLAARGVQFRFGEPIERISSCGSGFTIQTKAGTRHTGAIVSSIPLETLNKALCVPSPGLPSIDLMTLFVSADRLEARGGNVLFNFQAVGRWKRITHYAAIYPDPATRRTFFAAEVTLPPGQAPDPEAAFRDLATHLVGLGLSEDLRLEGYDLVAGAYPLYTPGYAATRQKQLDRVRAAGIVTVGRQGRFEYLPTSSGVFRQVEAELARAGLAAEPSR